MANKIKLKRGTKALLPVLDEAELGFCTDTKEIFIGSDLGNIRIATSGELGTDELNTIAKTIKEAINELNQKKENVISDDRKRRITYGEIEPSDSIDGDIHIQYIL